MPIINSDITEKINIRRRRNEMTTLPGQIIPTTTTITTQIIITTHNITITMKDNSTTTEKVTEGYIYKYIYIYIVYVLNIVCISYVLYQHST